MCFIRWIPTQVRVVAYFPNLVLISAFLGIGLGALLSKVQVVKSLLGGVILLLVSLTVTLGKCIISNNNPNEFLWLLYQDLPKDSPTINGIYLPLIALFIFSAICFIPLGQKLASTLQQFARREELLKGYCWDIAGSLLGVITFALISFSGLFPVYWFLLFGIVTIFLLLPDLNKPSIYGLIFTFAIATTLVSTAERADSYSPYYALKIKQFSENFWAILTNGSQHQVFQTMGLIDPKLIKNQEQAEQQLLRTGYHRPYKYISKQLKDVLIIGAGNGNDVAVALQNQVVNIDAVEIDPEIVEIGRRLHPDRPYQAENVRVITTDARSYINNTKKKYDLVIFATLDSMTKLSALSNVRLDNFIYTLQSIQSVKRVMKDSGGLVMNFSVHDPKIKIKLMGILAQSFEDVYKIEQNYLMFNVAYLAGKAFHNLKIDAPDMFKIDTKKVLANLDTIALPTDDWPYLYLNSNSISGFYWQIILSILAIAAVSIYGCARYVGISRREITKPDYEMYLLGLGFLLFESQAVVSMNLLWGTTWITSAVVFASILLMILLSTLLADRIKLDWKISFWGIFATLLCVYLVPLESLLYLGLTTKLVLSLLLVGVPIFFTGICFAQGFKAKVDPDHALAWNLFGAVCGGLLEFSSMIYGFKVLILIALVIYLTAFLVRKHSLLTCNS